MCDVAQRSACFTGHQGSAPPLSHQAKPLEGQAVTTPEDCGTAGPAAAAICTASWARVGSAGILARRCVRACRAPGWQAIGGNWVLIRYRGRRASHPRLVVWSPGSSLNAVVPNSVPCRAAGAD
jgi:hypothetical protein